MWRGQTLGCICEKFGVKFRFHSIIPSSGTEKAQCKEYQVITAQINMTLTQSSTIYISYRLICSWKVYYGESSVSITPIHTATLGFVSVKLSLDAAVVTSCHQSSRADFHFKLQHSPAYMIFRLRKSQGLCFWVSGGKKSTENQKRWLSSCFVTMYSVTWEKSLPFYKLWLFDEIFGESLSSYWESRAEECP